MYNETLAAKRWLITNLNGLPRFISNGTIFEASTHNQTPTSLCATAMKTRMKELVMSFLVSSCHPLASGVALSTTYF